MSVLTFCERALDKAGFVRMALRVRAANWIEAETRLLPLLVDRERVAIDVGAADGFYSWHLKRLARDVIAFEPNPRSAASLRKMVPRLDVRELALSNTKGSTSLRVPISGRVAASGWGTIHVDNDFSEISPDALESFMVQTARLDDLELMNVGFIKIDVEGHEKEVLEGAYGLLARDRPALLVETSGRVRGNDPGAVCKILQGLGYATLHLRDKINLATIDEVPPQQSAINLIALPRCR